MVHPTEFRAIQRNFERLGPIPTRSKVRKKRKSTRMWNGVKLWSLKKADDEFSKFIRNRDKKCYFTPCPNPASQNSHFWGRERMATRFDPLNCDGACGGCHMRHEGNKQGEYADRKRAQLGDVAYEELRKRAYSYKARNDAIYECMVFFGAVDNSVE